MAESRRASGQGGNAMEPIFGLMLYLFLLAIIVAIAAARKLAWWGFLLLTPIAGLVMAMMGSGASGGNGNAAGLSGFASLAIAGLMALAMKSREQKLADGEHVDGYKKCPFCAEPVRAEAVKCRHCGSALQPATPSG